MKLPTKLKAVPPQDAGANLVEYLPAAKLGREETVNGLVDGTIREAWRTVDGEVYVQRVPRHLAQQVVDGIPPQFS